MIECLIWLFPILSVKSKPGGLDDGIFPGPLGLLSYGETGQKY